MTDRHTTFNGEDGRHFTPQMAARFMFESMVGRYYKTHGEVWDVKPEVRIIGMLECIYEAITTKERDIDAERLEAHSEYLSGYYWKADTKLLNRMRSNLSRINCLCGGNLHLVMRSYRMRRTLSTSISTMAKLFADHRTCTPVAYKTYYGLQAEVVDLTNRLRSIKTLDDLTLLDGVGLRTVATIKSLIAQEKP